MAGIQIVGSLETLKRVHRRNRDNLPVHIKGQAFFETHGIGRTVPSSNTGYYVNLKGERLAVEFLTVEEEDDWYCLTQDPTSGWWYTDHTQKVERRGSYLGWWNIDDPQHPDYVLAPEIPAAAEEVIAGGLHHIATLKGKQPLSPQTPILPSIEAAAASGSSIPVNIPPTSAVPHTMTTAHIGAAIAPAATSQTIQTTNGGLKGNPPKVFTGDRAKSDGFLLAFRLFKAANRNNEQMSIPYSRVTTALTYMEGETIEGWKESQLDKLNDKVTTQRVAETSKSLWNDFEKDFKDAFTNTNKKMDAYRLLKGLKYGDNLDIFLAEFKRLVGAAGIDINSHGVIELLKEGLKPGLTQAVINSKDFDPQVDWTFQQWIDEAQKQHGKWKLAQQYRQGNKNHQQALYQAFGIKKQPNCQGNRCTTSQGGDAMDVDAINTTLTDEQKTELMRNNACFYCTKPGHRANDCRKKKADRKRSSQGTTSRPDNRIRTTETGNTAPDMTKEDITKFLKENMDTLDDDTKLSIANSLLPSSFVEAQN